MGRVHDAGVDVANLTEGKQVGRMGRVAELIGGGLVDRHRPGPGGGIGFATHMNLLGLKTPLVSHGGKDYSPNPDSTSRN